MPCLVVLSELHWGEFYLNVDMRVSMLTDSFTETRCKYVHVRLLQTSMSANSLFRNHQQALFNLCSLDAAQRNPGYVGE